MKAIPSAPKYWADEAGNIVSPKTGKTMKPQSDRRAGYWKVRVKCSDGKTRSRYVHHLVAEAFLGPRPDGKDLDHIDGDRRNNRPDNLRYCSRRENQDNVNNAGANYWQKCAKRGVVATKNGVDRRFTNASEAAHALGLCLSGVSNALSCRRVNKGYRNGKPRFCHITTCGGYSFRWAGDVG